MLTGAASGASPEQALVEYGSLVVVLLIGWLLLSTAVTVLARLSGRLSLMRAAGWITLPFVRRLAERIVVVVLAIVAGLGPIGRATASMPSGVVASGGGGSIGLAAKGADPPGEPPAPSDGLDDSGMLPFDPSRPPPVAREVPTAGVSAAPGTTEAIEYVVVRGDNLWVIAERHLAWAMGRAPGDHETAPYWLQIIAQNRARLTSGNPDLIYPGEVIVCPPLSVEAPPSAP